MANHSAVIRNPRSDLVLDPSHRVMRMQRFTGSPSQFWTLEPTYGGKFFIVNKGNGKAVDIEGGPKSCANIITYSKHGGVNQQWFVNSDNTLVCVAGNLALDICEQDYHAGTKIIAYPKHGSDNQQFVFEYK